jgi:4-hydroxy-tetrahydrodipicolinate synthase
MKLHGVIPAVITPMDEQGQVDPAALERQVTYLSKAGVHGFFVGGTTAEGAYLSTEELRTLCAVVRGAARDGQFLCLASLRASTAMVRAEIEALASLEPDFVVIIAPYYLAASQVDILEHFREILEVSPAPVIVYNIPSTTHNPICLETVLRLAREPGIAGTKDSSRDFISFSRGVLGHRDAAFAWIQGEDYLHGPSLLIGAQGLVSGLGNVRIDDYVAMYEAAGRNDWDAVREGQRRVNRLYGIIRALDGRTIPAIKAAASVLGRCQPFMRIRSMSPPIEDIRKVEQALSSLGTDS